MTVPAATRRCIHPLCEKLVTKRNQVVCGRHWHRLSLDVQRRYDAARSREERGSLQAEMTQEFEQRIRGKHEIVECNYGHCTATIIYLPTQRGKWMPVDADSVGADDDLYDSEKHVPHFGTCVARLPLEDPS